MITHVLGDAGVLTGRSLRHRLCSPDTAYRLFLDMQGGILERSRRTNP